MNQARRFPPLPPGRCGRQLSQGDVSHDSHSPCALVPFPSDFPLGRIVPKGEPAGWERSFWAPCRAYSRLGIPSSKGPVQKGHPAPFPGLLSPHHLLLCSLPLSIPQGTLFRSRVGGYGSLALCIAITLRLHLSGAAPASWGEKGASPYPQKMLVRFGDTRGPRGAPSSGAVSGCPHVRVPRAGGSQGGRLQVRAGSGF